MSIQFHGLGVRSHSSAIDEPDSIRDILSRLTADHVALEGGINREVLREQAVIETVTENGLVLRASGFDPEALRPGTRLLLNARVPEGPYFFFVDVRSTAKSGAIHVSRPTAMYRAERRDRERMQPGTADGPRRVVASLGSLENAVADVADFSAEGLGIRTRAFGTTVSLGQTGHVRFLDGKLAGQIQYARLCSVASVRDAPGWTRIGLQISAAPFGEQIQIERRRNALGAGFFGSLRTQATLVSAGVRSAIPLARWKSISREPIELVEFDGGGGEPVRGIVDRWGDSHSPVAVVIPPAWGKTKETLLPLAATVVESFRQAGEPVVVLRFDGIRKRGESHNDPECLASGSEQHHFTFSQGVRDIQAAVRYLREGRGLIPKCTVLVTFSAASIEGRRAAALERERINGWISVVGAADLQSAMREVSGGVDYVAGAQSGVRFGLQQIQGVEVDMDLAAADALREHLAFMEDARLDMSQIAAPVTWIHGQFDAWMSLDRCRALLSVQGGPRRLVVVPTGHQLRSSRQALAVFQLIASEIGTIALRRQIEPRLPDMNLVQARGRRERARLKRRPIELQHFWKEYLLGRGECVGIELMTATSPYRKFLSQQIAMLELVDGSRVVDLGSGTGSFCRALGVAGGGLSGLRITEVDFVRDALLRSRSACSTVESVGFEVHRLVADLASAASAIPLRDSSYDAVLASLLISYLGDPAILIGEARRVLRPGGKIVVSTMRPDADTSLIFAESSQELRAGQGEDGVISGAPLENSLRSFLNDAARLLDLEEQGVFRFWDRKELRRLLEDSGFQEVRVRSAFGSPPQALIASGIKMQGRQ